jgi:uncharacterized protein (TIGR02118 family)
MEPQLFCATVLYPNKENASFDFELYSKTLILKYVEVLGENCIRYEIRKGLTTPGAPSPQFICIANFWIRSGEQFAAAMSDPGMKEIMKEIAAFTDIQPVRQFDMVIS